MKMGSVLFVVIKVLINLQETDIIIWDCALWNGHVMDFSIGRKVREDKLCQ